MLAPVAYTHTDVGYTALIAVAVAGVLFVFAAWAIRAQDAARDQPPRRVAGGLAVVFGLLLASAFVFSRMTVSVRHGSLSWSFALGALRHQVPISDVVAASVVGNRANDGVGIHRTASGTLYNVGGAWSVRVQLRDGSQLRLGTDQPDSLLRAIQASGR